ncbi:hypothetical protein SAMN04488136_1367 [Vibrio xiamenensis]|uniref:Secreted protein n=1 Tax=Vibrio xiamenensis TaxID=861298 RepID=A0A1G8GD90_9VIBR|nr:hypothetical protein [Vibrio xiamenensis]SDH92334.1 hypothetical protein SAMN04488136_1367 [Vibrio xiamenensis]
MMPKSKLALTCAAMILSGYSLQASCEDSSSSSLEDINAAIEARLEMEKKQQELTHTLDFVSDERGERDSLLDAPIKTDDAVTYKPSKSQQSGSNK